MPEPEDIEEYWSIARPSRASQVTPEPSEPATVEEMRRRVSKLTKEVLSMGLAIMVNNGDVSSPEVVAGYARELERLKKGTLIQLTLLAGVPLKSSIDAMSRRTLVRSRAREEKYKLPSA